MGFGYDHNVLAERAHPTRQVLDRFFPDAPVLITHASGHMGVANSKSLALMGVTAETPDPEGGRIGREADGRTPSGYLEELAFRQATAKVPMDRAADAAAALDAAQQIYLSRGITLIQDGLTGADEFQMLSAAARAGVFTADVVLRRPQEGPGALVVPLLADARGRVSPGGLEDLFGRLPPGSHGLDAGALSGRRRDLYRLSHLLG